MRRTSIWRRQAATPWKRKLPFYQRKQFADAGQLSRASRGNLFSEPEFYRNKVDIGVMLATSTTVQKRLVDERRAAERGERRTYPDYREDTEVAATPEGRRRQHFDDAAELELQGETTQPPFTIQMRLAMDRDKNRSVNSRDNTPMVPRSKEEVNRLTKHLQQLDSGTAAAEMHNRLAQENGVFAPQRMEAFMLSDETIFPDWVKALSPSIRDQVMYGGMGLSAEDDVVRVNLARLPMDRRRVEWERLRRAREYKDGVERPLSTAEVRGAKLCHRSNHYLARRRRDRAGTIAQLALAKPEQYQVFPTKDVDYSQRLATIAKHIEAGVSTGGKWPLSADDLARAQLRKKREEVRQTFLDDDARKLLMSKKMHPAVLNALQSLDQEPRVIKRVSRSEYKKRWHRVTNGHGDEVGREYKKVYAWQRGDRLNKVDTMREVALTKEVASQLHGRPEGTARIWTDSKDWSPIQQLNNMRSEHGPRSPGFTNPYFTE